VVVWSWLARRTNARRTAAQLPAARRIAERLPATRRIVPPLPAAQRDQTTLRPMIALHRPRAAAFGAAGRQTIQGDRMSDLKAQFERAVADSKTLSERPDNQTLLKLYALYKQAASGDVDGKRPGFTDMVGRAKWDAWNELKGTGTDDAMTQYVALIEELKG
jgi:diazepam-binding inhibitor (GABA receptor modulating acyl-CoA-binding protein)